MSQDIARWLERDVRVPASRVRRLYSGVDAQRFSPEGASAIDAPWPASADAVTVGTIGRLDPVKNQSWLLESCHTILERHPELRGRLRLIIAGEGPLRVELQQAAERMGIGSQLWLPGGRSDIPELMRSLDVFVLPSLNEGISNTILEAMACARPVVAARVGGNVELVAHDVTGLLYEPGDREGLARALARYVAEPELRLRHGRAARERALEGFSLEAMVRRYADFYDELLVKDH